VPATDFEPAYFFDPDRCLLAVPAVTYLLAVMVIRHIAPAPPLLLEKCAEAMPHWTDAELVEALVERDPRAGLELYDRLIRVVEWTILRVMGRRGGEHEDLVQAAFEQIVMTLYKRRYAQDCSLTSWASAISCHIALNALRAARRGRLFQAEGGAIDAEPHARTDPEGQLAARHALEKIRAELARMNPDRAEVLVLHEINGLDLSEIASALRISVAAAQSRLSRGRRELIERLGSAGKGGELT
jgi:RNA polymerase sigma-70 factor (ECF subfamily)